MFNAEKMNRIIVLFGLGLLILGCSEKKKDTNLKSLLIEQLKNSHENQEWFVPTKIAIDDITAEQSSWKDSSENHSIGELVFHLYFWNEMNLRAFNGEDMTDFNVDNEITFKKYSDTEWKTAIRKLDSIQKEWELMIKKASEEQLLEWSSEITNMTAHNAYHTGQIIYIRKRNGWWDKK